MIIVYVYHQGNTVYLFNNLPMPHDETMTETIVEVDEVSLEKIEQALEVKLNAN